MLIHHLSWGAMEWDLASEHFPYDYSKRVEVRANVNRHSGELLRAGELRCSSKASRHRNGGLRTRFIDGLRQPEVDDFRDHCASLLEIYHDVARFDIAMDGLLFVHRGQTRGNLGRDFER